MVYWDNLINANTRVDGCRTTDNMIIFEYAEQILPIISFFPAHIQENIFDTYPRKIDIIFTKLNPAQYIMKHIV